MIELIKNNDVAYKNTLTTTEAAKILGLKYHTARNMLIKNKIDCIDYGGKTVWLEDAVLDYKRSRYKTSEEKWALGNGTKMMEVLYGNIA